ncbi:MAG: hypothetical protein EOP10_02740 [Proteobacteria bacterium]|nr:MAG: hypothetical protein EOP10_02740 [Pseudomonadota bacterium]
MILRISFLAALSLIPYGCNSNNVAADYIAKNGSGSASGLKTGDSKADTSQDSETGDLGGEDKTDKVDETDTSKPDEDGAVDDKEKMDNTVPDTKAPEPKKEEEKVPTPAAGNAVAGAAIIKSTCSLCHAPGKPAADVTLNAAAIARLDDAINGAQKANHAGFKDNFVAPKRADLEAGMKAAK